MKSNPNFLHAVAAALVLSASGLCFAGGDPAAGKEKSQTCQSCHGPDGNSPTPQFPRLAGQYEDYLLHSLREYKSGARKNAIMAGMVAPLTDADMENLAAFYSRQSGLTETAGSAFR